MITQQKHIATEHIVITAKGPQCNCGSTHTVPTGFGGYQEPDPSRNMPLIDGDEYGCNDCGRCFF